MPPSSFLEQTGPSPCPPPRSSASAGESHLQNSRPGRGPPRLWSLGGELVFSL